MRDLLEVLLGLSCRRKTVGVWKNKWGRELLPKDQETAVGPKSRGPHS